jgi:hypothetical protein
LRNLLYLISLNNVVITGASGFVAIAKPQFYGEG